MINTGGFLLQPFVKLSFRIIGHEEERFDAVAFLEAHDQGWRCEVIELIHGKEHALPVERCSLHLFSGRREPCIFIIKRTPPRV